MLFLQQCSRVLALSFFAFAAGCGSKEAPAPAASGSAAASGTAAASGAPAASGAAATVTAAAATPPPAATPEALVKSYLELGAAGDLSKIKDLVEAKCHATKVGEVDAVKMLGARMTVSEVITSMDSQEGDGARVKYTVKGSIDAKNARAETDIFGKKMEVKVGSMSMSNIAQSGVLTVKKIDGRWVVSC